MSSLFYTALINGGKDIVGKPLDQSFDALIMFFTKYNIEVHFKF